MWNETDAYKTEEELRKEAVNKCERSLVQRMVKWHGWHWPRKPENSYSPWYYILWKGIWAPVIYCGVSLIYLGLLMTLGKNDADTWIRTAI